MESRISDSVDFTADCSRDAWGGADCSAGSVLATFSFGGIFVPFLKRDASSISLGLSTVGAAKSARSSSSSWRRASRLSLAISCSRRCCSCNLRAVTLASAANASSTGSSACSSFTSSIMLTVSWIRLAEWALGGFRQSLYSCPSLPHLKQSLEFCFFTIPLPREGGVLLDLVGYFVLFTKCAFGVFDFGKNLGFRVFRISFTSVLAWRNVRRPCRIIFFPSAFANRASARVVLSSSSLSSAISA